MVCRVELERSILQSWLTNFISKSTQAEAATVLLQMYICGQGFTK